MNNKTSKDTAREGGCVLLLFIGALGILVFVNLAFAAWFLCGGILGMLIGYAAREHNEVKAREANRE